MEPSPEDPDSDDSYTSSDYSGYSVTLPEREPQVDSAPGSTTKAPSEVRSDPEEFLDAQLEVKLYTLGGSCYIVWLDRDATMGQLVSKLKPQLPPQQRDVNYCAIVTSGTNPEIYSLRFPHIKIMCVKPVTDLIATRTPITLQLVWITPQEDYWKYRLRDRSRTPT